VGPPRPGGALSARLRGGAAALGAAGLSAWAALTRPFTAPADLVTALGLALVGAAAVRGWRRAPAALPSARRWWPWVAFGAVVVAWELTCLFLGPRVDHPTVSSFYDAATRAQPVKGACFFGWLWLGAALVRR